MKKTIRRSLAVALAVGGVIPAFAAEVVPVRADDAIDGETTQAIGDIEGELGSAGEHNSIGYRQFALDPERSK